MSNKHNKSYELVAKAKKKEKSLLGFFTNSDTKRKASSTMEMTQFAMVEELALLIKDNLFCKHLVLSTEEAFVAFLQNDSSTEGILELKPMSSYERLLVHRLADIFGLAHESVGEGGDRHLVLEQCPESSMPSILVGDILCQIDDYQPVMTTHILKREAVPALSKREIPLPSVTMEEREAAYQAARERIFAMHLNDKKEPVAVKPRNIPVVARRMIAHALGKSIHSNASNQNFSLQNCDNNGLEEFSNERVICSNSTSKTTKEAKSIPINKMQRPEEKSHGKYASRNGSCHDSQAEKKVNRMEPMNHSRDSKVLPDSGDGRTGGVKNLERELGAAKRMFAHALGLPSAKGLQCNEPSKGCRNGR